MCSSQLGGHNTSFAMRLRVHSVTDPLLGACVNAIGLPLAQRVPVGQI